MTLQEKRERRKYRNVKKIHFYLDTINELITHIQWKINTIVIKSGHNILFPSEESELFINKIKSLEAKKNYFFLELEKLNK